MPNLGVSPVDYGTDVGIVRALLGDDDAENVTAGVGEYAWFGDNAIEAILNEYGGNRKRTAARMLLTVAASQALLLKKWSADDLSVDGAAIAEALRKQAAVLMDEADSDENAVDIFEISYPGRTAHLVPELSPFPHGARIGISAEGPYTGNDPDDWTIDGDGYIVNG